MVTLDGRDLPMQLIYDGKTARTIPRVDFQSFFSLSANPKHLSNTDEPVKIVKETIVSYFESQKKELGLDEKCPTLLVLDVFRGQMIQEVTSLLAEKNILFVTVPNNIKHLLLPLDISVNSWVKQWMRQRFKDWYAEQIRAGLERSS